MPLMSAPLPSVLPALLSALLIPLLLATPVRAQPAEEVPFVTTPDNVTLALLQLAGVGARDHVIDLGSGDGRIVITAARRFGASGLGVEIVPDLVARSRASAEQAGVAARAEFREQDLFQTDLSRATVVTMYLLPEVNLQLRPRLLALAPGTRIVSHDWDMGDWLPDESVSVDAPDKKIGREKKSVLHRWVVPARAEGLWCGPAGRELRVTQQFQVLQARWRQGRHEWPLQGRLDGTQLQLLGALPARGLRGHIDGDRLRLGPQVPGLELRRSAAADCPG